MKIKFLSILAKSLWIGLLIGFLFLFLFIQAIKIDFLGLFGGMPSLERLENPKSDLASVIYTSDFEELGKYFRYNRTPIKYEDISPNFINALLATEDVRFEEHSGIDLKGMLAITWYLIKGDSRGSSTITQQLAKNLFSTRSESFKGTLGDVKVIKTVIIKAKEWITAIKLEESYTKKEIMTMYLNTVDFGSNAYGLLVASKTFFDKKPSELTISESAILVGVLKAPTLYSPILNPENALRRRNTVIDQIFKYNFISNKSTADSLKRIPIELNYKIDNHNTGYATYFRTVTMDYLISWCKERGYDLFADGLKIYTTIDSRAQKYAEEAVEKHMKFIQKQFETDFKGKNPWIDENTKEIENFIPNVAKRTERYRSLYLRYPNHPDSIEFYMNKKRKMRIFTWKGEKDTLFSSYDSLRHYKRFLQAGLLGIEPHTGHIKVWVGGLNHKFFKYDHVKQGKRQPGSTFKPFVYVAALDNGFDVCTEVKDIPVTFQYENGTENISWTPKNSEDEYTGETFTLRQAMARSINSITAYLTQQLGPQRVVEYAKRMGIKSDLEAVPSICLGSSDLSLYEQTSAYCTFVNHGIHTEPIFITRIEDKNGNLIQEFVPKTTEAISEQTAYKMIHMLKGGLEERKGTSQGLFRYPSVTQGNEVGGKTGTTSNYSDGWYMGVTENLVVGIWVGGDDRSIHFSSYTYGQGAKLALPIFGIFMEKVYADTTCSIKKSFFTRPTGLIDDFNCSKLKRMQSKEDSVNMNNKSNQLLDNL